MEPPDILGLGITSPTRKKPRFWPRQFASTVTRPQIYFDVVFGIIGPALCFVFDPLVFRGWFIQPALLADYQTFAYLFSGVQIILLCYWLLTGPGVEFRNELFGGVFLTGGFFCLVLATLLAPLSLMGLFLGIGIFGFTPFLTALVFFRNGVRALRSNPNPTSLTARTIVAGTGMLLITGLPILFSLQIRSVVNTAVEEVLHGDQPHAIFAAHRLVPLHYFAEGELDRIVSAYSSERDDARKELLKSCYFQITGESIEQRLRTMD